MTTPRERDPDLSETKDYEHCTLSITLGFGIDAPNVEAWMDEKDFRVCYEYANKDFDTFIKLLRFITSFGSKP